MPRLSRTLHAMLVSGQINRREANHIQWEADLTRGAIRAKVSGGRTQAARGRKQASDDAKRESGQRFTGGRRVRNNRREY